MSSSCQLSPTAHAFSTVLTAFVGSIVNGLTNGALIAFITGWIAWLSMIRVVVAALYEYWLSIKAGTTLPAEYEAVPANNGIAQVELGSYPAVTNQPAQSGKFTSRTQATDWLARGLAQDVKLTGWIGWVWSGLYTPISQSIWVATNITTSDGNAGGIKLARAVAIGVSALGLTFDNKQRYAASLGRKWGTWAFVVFNFWNATACLILGAEAAVLLIWGARDLNLQWFYYAVYIFFSLIWAAMSFKILPIVDGSRRGVNIFVDILVGAFAGIFVAAPALMLWQNASFAAKTAQMMGDGSSSDGLSLGAYLSCEGASGLAKFAAIMP